jgi:hypothetical protein
MACIFLNKRKYIPQIEFISYAQMSESRSRLLEQCVVVVGSVREGSIF